MKHDYEQPQHQQQQHHQHQQQMAVRLSRMIFLLAATLVALASHRNCILESEARANNELAAAVAANSSARSERIARSHDQHKAMMHNHLSRKVFDRACAASKDSIDEIVACLTNSETLITAIKEDTAKGCYKESFGENFDPKDVNKHKELICKNRDKFETMTACIYRKTSELLDPKQMEKFTESLVDVGLCIINALDG